MICGKDNCIQNNDFWWDPTDDCCERRKSKHLDWLMDKKINYDDFCFLISPQHFNECNAYFQNTLKCVPATISNTLQLLEITSQDHHQEPGVLDHVFRNKGGGERVIATPKMEIGVLNVYPAQVILIQMQ